MFQVHEVLPKHFLHLANHRLERSLRHRISDRHPMGSQVDSLPLGFLVRTPYRQLTLIYTKTIRFLTMKSIFFEIKLF